MVKSMTGFGRGEHADENYNIVVEIKSINHRYSDFSIKMPRKYSFAEEELKAGVKEYIKRGKAEINVTVESHLKDDIDVELNMEVAKKYCAGLYKIEDEFGLAGEIDINVFCQLPEIFKIVPAQSKEELFLSGLKQAARIAVESIDEMRILEGKHLEEDIRKRAGYIKQVTEEIEKYAPEVSEKYTVRLKDRIKELLGNDFVIPEDRILLEAAIFADKSNITEEIVRLKSHIEKLLKILEESKEPEGKKLDFLMQEMNREANTIGSKANDVEIVDNVLILKSEIEKIREQVQNIE